MNRYLQSIPACLSAACVITATVGGCAIPAAPAPWMATMPAVDQPQKATPAAPERMPQGAPPSAEVATPTSPEFSPVRPVTYEQPTSEGATATAAPTASAPLHTGMPAYSHGYVGPAYYSHGAIVGHPAYPAPAHPAGPCTAGCCGTQGPQYPSMPPMSAFGMDPQEFLCDGGDQPPHARIRYDDAIVGVDLEDTVVKYETARGTEHVTPSNRVCIYAPRFAAVRRVSGAITGEQVTGPIGYYREDNVGGVLAPLPSSTVRDRLSPEDSDLARGPDAVRNRDAGINIDTVAALDMQAQKLAPLAELSIIQTGVLRDADKPWLAKGAAAAIVWSRDENVHVTIDNVVPVVLRDELAPEEMTLYELPGGRLRVIKLADRDSAQVGDIVTFILRIDNTGEGRLDNVVLTDNLTTRLEYVEGSQTSTKGTVFETSENDGGSLRLTWTFTDDFEVGESAIIRFRCRVR